MDWEWEVGYGLVNGMWMPLDGQGRASGESQQLQENAGMLSWVGQKVNGDGDFGSRFGVTESYLLNSSQ